MELRAPSCEQGQRPGQELLDLTLPASPPPPPQPRVSLGPYLHVLQVDLQRRTPVRSGRSSRSPAVPSASSPGHFPDCSGLWASGRRRAPGCARLRDCPGRGPCARERGRRRRREGPRDAGGGEGNGGELGGRPDRGLNLDTNLNRYCPSQGRAQESEPRLH